MADSTCVDCAPEVSVAFTPPTEGTLLPMVIIEYCNRCHWQHRAAWVQTELLITFENAIRSTMLVPHGSETAAGIFRVWLRHGGGETLLWDRKKEGGFPELKVLKQRVRDFVDPTKKLGHSEAKESG